MKEGCNRGSTWSFIGGIMGDESYKKDGSFTEIVNN
ncbi:hypothetical protein X926_08915 [Petrotoga sp. HWHPT.55.6.3]|nr:hypothetical protein X926_08915 [Petrotoga sp. HWHPT.55.6.3]